MDVLSKHDEDAGGAGELKRTCEECTRSKVKCSGPDSGVCERCHSRGTECIFRPKMKRGPQPHGATIERKPTPDQKRMKDEQSVGAQTTPTNSEGETMTGNKANDLGFAAMSWHERRCWNVFFSTFRQQNKKENPISWCWFALQLEKLRKDLERMQNQPALDRLEAWMNKLHTKMSSLKQQTNQVCNFAPHLCAGCSSVAQCHREGKPIYKGSADFSGTSSSIFQRLTKPFIEFEMDKDGARIVEVSNAFTQTFGHTNESLASTLAWSGGGSFLPWGGDLVSRLLWSEADVLIFLQVLAIKFQALGPPRHDHSDPEHVMTREVLSAYIFDVRIKSDNNTFEELVIPCMIKSLHRETLVGKQLKITVILEFDPLGPAKVGPELPESSKEAIAASRLMEEQFSRAHDQSNQSLDIASQSNPGSVNVLGGLSAQEDLDLLSGFEWPTMEGQMGDILQSAEDDAYLENLLDTL